MNAREERGLIIAATCKLNRNADGTWLVPAQTNKTAVAYTVNLDTKACTCLDCKDGKMVCKHYYAACIVHKREVMPNGDVIDTKSVTFTERKTFTQNWTAYNLAQSTEKHRFQQLLFELTRGIAEPPMKPGPGRKPHTTKDSLFAMAMKVYGTLSSRRSSCDFKDAHGDGYTANAVPGMKVNKFFENPTLTPILKALIAESARPLRSVDRKSVV